MKLPFQTLVTLPLILLPCGLAPAQETADSIVGPVAKALEELGSDARVFEDHVVFLANPYLEGRLPGTHGMEVAKDYVEYWFEDAGLVPAFPSSNPDGQQVPRTSWRQPFTLGARPQLVEAALRAGQREFEHRVEFMVPGWGASGQVEAPVVFVGYGLRSGPEDSGYSGFPEGTDLSGKIALLFQDSPMDEDGEALWGPVQASRARNVDAKLRAVAELGASGVLVVNAPGSKARRADRMLDFSGRRQAAVEVPAVQLSSEAGQALLEAFGRGELLALRREADAGGVVRDLGGTVSLTTEIDRNEIIAENVGGLLPGRGRLAGELLVLGAHLDHLGKGTVGTRDGGAVGQIHPGADDNATGTAAVMMIAKRLVADYEAMDPSADARSVLFLAFSAEEQGLLGAKHYCTDPIMPIEDHSLMVNFDMIGRITNKRLAVSGLGTGGGLKGLVEPLFEDSPLEIVAQDGAPPNSDHWAFYQAEVPVLFGIIADFHDDYHTPRDQSWKINREDAVLTIDLFHEILRKTAVHAEPIRHIQVAQGNRRPGAAAQRGPAITVRVGVRPEAFGSGAALRLASVSDGPAKDAGLEAGDVITHWAGEAVDDVPAWMGMLRRHKPGDKVKVKYKRGDEENEAELELTGRGE